MTDRGEQVFRLLLRLYRREFREAYERDLIAFFKQDRAHPRYGAGLLRPMRFWSLTMSDLLKAVWRGRRARPSPVDSSRPLRGTRWVRDLRTAWRGLWSAPLVTIAALLVLTIGIGASTAVFSVVDAVVLRGLPFPADEELVLIRENSRGAGGIARGIPARPQTFLEWQRRQRTFTQFGAATGDGLQMIVDAPAANVSVTRITASLLDVLGVRPAIGRAFGPADEQAGAHPVALISDALWRSRFGALPAAIGRTMTLKTGQVLEIVGVMPPEFRYPITATADVWIPWVPDARETIRGNTFIYSFSVIGRLAPGISVTRATAHMDQLHKTLAAEDPHWFEGHEPSVQLLRDAVVSGSVRSWMMLLLAAVGGVLLIACLNVANLLVARAVARAPELGMRAALGATRWDLSRVLLLESVMLSLLGAASGVVLATWGVEILRSSLPATVPRLATVSLDLRVIAVAVTAALATGLAFGTLPALQASRRDLVALVGHGSRSEGGGRAGRAVRTALVVGEVAIASVLLVGSGLFLASFLRVTAIPLGFDPRHVISLTGGYVSTRAIGPPQTADERAKIASARTTLDEAMGRLRAVPGVTAVAAVGGGRPLGGSSMTVELRPDDLPPDRAAGPEPYVRSVTPGYLDVVRGSLVQGRWFTESDGPGADPVMVMSDDAAGVYFAGRQPIGQRVMLGGHPFVVVGVIRAMRFRGPESDLAPEVFVPLSQGSYPTAEIVVRTAPDPVPLVPALHAALRTVLPDQTLRSETLEGDYTQMLAQRKFNMVVLSLFGIVAIVVAALGVYGLMAYLVEGRRREIGVRVALGAEPIGILRMVLARATMLIVVGLAAGIAAAALVEHLIRAFLFEPQPYDPSVYGAAALALLMAGLVAAFGPARRAARVDPLVALRAE